MKWYQVVGVAEEVQILRERVIVLRYGYIVNLVALIVGLCEWLYLPMLSLLNDGINLNYKIEFGPRSKRTPSQLHFTYNNIEARSCNHGCSGRAINYLLHILSVCSLSYPVRNAHASYCYLWPARLYSIFPHYLINGTIFEEEKKCY
jgi:hypothetical protein